MFPRLAEWWDGSLRAADEVTLFPSVAWKAPTGWQWSVSGTVIYPAARPILERFFRWALGVHRLRFSGSENELLRERGAPFLVKHQSRRKLHLRIGGRLYRLDPSSRTGHFHGSFSIDPEVLTDDASPTTARILQVVVRLGSGRRERDFPLSVHFLHGPGLDVISDIDDTLKITNVRDKPDAIRNTFLRPFQAVPGMAAKLSGWATAHRAQIHYVTGSPWQLYRPLSDFARAQGFPLGSWAMQSFRLHDRASLHRLRRPEIHKAEAIRTLLARAADRTFVCVGDSSDRDPEVYGAIAREFSGRVRRIFIRDVTGEAPDGRRYMAAFAGLSGVETRIFRDARELPALLL